MSLARAQQIVARSSQSAGVNSALREMLKEVLEEVYFDMANSAPDIEIEGGTGATVPEGGGDVDVTVDRNGNTFTINLTAGA